MEIKRHLRCAFLIRRGDLITGNCKSMNWLTLSRWADCQLDGSTLNAFEEINFGVEVYPEKE